MIRKMLKQYGRKVGQMIGHCIVRENIDAANSLAQQIQQSLALEYIKARQDGRTYFSNIRDAGFRVYSEFEEDGIILYVLTLIGFGNRRVVEICAGNGTECMATNLILNHGFDGFLFDGNKRSVEHGRAFFRKQKDSFLSPPLFQQAWITVENVNRLLREAGATGEVDLFSLDMDGNDYWIWKAIDVIRPRFCVFETHNIIPSELSLTIRYEPDFYCWNRPVSLKDYRSVSLRAMVRLSQEKGYRLIGAHRYGFNAFFLRNDIAPHLFPAVSIEQVHDNPWTRLAREQRWPLVKDLDWVEV